MDQVYEHATMMEHGVDFRQAVLVSFFSVKCLVGKPSYKANAMQMGANLPYYLLIFDSSPQFMYMKTHPNFHFT